MRLVTGFLAQLTVREGAAEKQLHLFHNFCLLRHLPQQKRMLAVAPVNATRTYSYVLLSDGSSATLRVLSTVCTDPTLRVAKTPCLSNTWTTV